MFLDKSCMKERLAHIATIYDNRSIPDISRNSVYNRKSLDVTSNYTAQSL